ncbi:hypothetical protein SCORR_v1c09540 [Spiroplasma corruscae]|uniref:Uncharacterized protein n=1 Tax=Spiroplasma corruscae TaxID=216934 RepID=A0A222EQN2_9MOLU|nr:hypothetical protein [Spiroplasma corruscae]ASP28726.1 hypothetical protein SCORR_v1c09540 [Spiroplasma corruscae]
MDKVKDTIALGVYKLKLFVQQLVLTNGKDWLLDVVTGLLTGFSKFALDKIPVLNTLFKVPGSQWITNKLVIIPLSAKLATYC